MVTSRLTALLLLLLSVQFAQAESLLIGRGDGQYPPYEWIENKQLKGIHIDLVNQAAQNLNVPITILSYPWSRCLLELKDGRLHALTFMGKNPEREHYTRYLEGNILSETRIKLFRRAQKAPFAFDGNLQILKGKTIAVQPGYFYGNAFEDADAFTRLPVKTAEQMLKTVYLERVNFGIINQLELSFNFRNDAQLREIEFIDPPISQMPSYLGFSKKSTDENLASRFASEIESLRNSDFYQQLLSKYDLQ